MDVDFPTKSSPFSSSSSGDDESHLDMMSMMMQMDKLPDFFDPNFPPQNPSQFPAGFQIPSSSVHSSAVQTVQLIPPPPQNPSSFLSSMEKKNSTAAIREMIFRIAAMQPVHIDPESIKPPKRRNVRISKDPQSVAARHRRERISERIRILQRLVPGGTKMDTASMLDEAVHYVKFLKKQVQTLEQAGANRTVLNGFGFNGLTMGNNHTNNNININGNNNNLGFNSLLKNCQQGNSSFLGSMQMLR